MFLVGLELDPRAAQGSGGTGRCDLQRQRRAPDDARDGRRAADLRAGRRRTRSSSPSRCSWAWRCRSPRSRCSRGSSWSGGCSSARSARWHSRAPPIDDVTAWFLIALATAVAVAGCGRGGRRDDRAWPWCSALVMGFVGPAAPRPRVDRVRRGRARARRLGRGDLRRRPAVGVRHRGDRHRADLRRLHHGHDHAAATRGSPRT